MRNIFLIIAIGLITPAMFGQDAERFAGTWVLDKEASFSRKSDREAYQYYNLVLSFEGDRLTVKKDFEFRKRKANYKTVLFTDKRGETTIIPEWGIGRSEITSKTHWKKNEIITEFTIEREMGLPNITRLEHTTEKYALSENGQNLIFTLGQVAEIKNTGTLRYVTNRNLNFRMKLIFRRQ